MVPLKKDLMAARSTSVWLSRVLFESLLIMISILAALGLDEWRDNQQNDEIVEKAMSNFLSEIRQNKARVEDAAPFNKGLRDVLDRRHQEGSVTSTDDFIAILESYNPVVLQSTAWDTALATGSVTKMDYNLVSALSLTYGLQERYQQATENGMVDLMGPKNLSSQGLELAIYNSIRYLDKVTAMETELGAVYAEAEELLKDAWTQTGDVPLEEPTAAGETP